MLHIDLDLKLISIKGQIEIIDVVN